MKSRFCNAWCGLFTTLGAGVSLLTVATLKIPTSLKNDAATFFNDTLTSSFGLYNKTIEAHIDILSNLPVHVRISEFVFTLQKILSDKMLHQIENVPDDIKDAATYIFAIGGVVVLTLSAGLLFNTMKTKELANRVEKLEEKFKRFKSVNSGLEEYLLDTPKDKKSRTRR